MRAHRELLGKSRKFHRRSRRLAARVQGLTVALAALTVCDVGLVVARTKPPTWGPASHLMAPAIPVDPVVEAAHRDLTNRALLARSRGAVRDGLATIRSVRAALVFATRSR